MDGGSGTGSLDRIEAALGRIEAQVDALRDGQAGSSAHPEATGDSGPDAALAQRHQALRTSVEAALTRIDALIEAQDQ